MIDVIRGRPDWAILTSSLLLLLLSIVFLYVDEAAKESFLYNLDKLTRHTGHA